MYIFNNQFIKFNFQETSDINFIIFILITLTITVLLLLLATWLSTLRKPSNLKRTEGFETFEFGTTSIGNSSLNTINKHFYILGLLFIIFDIELMFIFPWIYNNSFLNYNSKDLLIIFTIFIILGFLYEISSGALNWYNPPSLTLKNRFGINNLWLNLDWEFILCLIFILSSPFIKNYIDLNNFIFLMENIRNHLILNINTISVIKKDQELILTIINDINSHILSQNFYNFKFDHNVDILMLNLMKLKYTYSANILDMHKEIQQVLDLYYLLK